MTKLNTDSSGQGLVLGNKVLVAEVFAKNGFLVLSSGTGDEKTDEVSADQVSQDKGGGLLASDEITLIIDLELTSPAEAAAPVQSAGVSA